VSQTRFPARKYLVWTLAVLTTVLVVVFGVAIFTRPPNVFIDCNGRAPISRPSPGQVVFTGKILTTLGPCVLSQGRPSCTGAVAVVKEGFFGTRSKLLLLTQGYFEKDQEYLIDGVNFRSAVLSRLLPIVGFTGGCTHSARVKDADVDLRILRDKSPQRGVRIIGKLTRRNGRQREAVAAAKVVIIGPQGTVTVETDNQGIYDVSGLPAGHYEVHSELRGQDPWYTQCWNGEELNPGDVGGCAMFIE
jgi:hypothetical protein